jgi:hypothetical protein
MTEVVSVFNTVPQLETGCLEGKVIKLANKIEEYQEKNMSGEDTRPTEKKN